MRVKEYADKTGIPPKRVREMCVSKELPARWVKAFPPYWEIEDSALAPPPPSGAPDEVAREQAAPRGAQEPHESVPPASAAPDGPDGWEALAEHPEALASTAIPEAGEVEGGPQIKLDAEGWYQLVRDSHMDEDFDRYASLWRLWSVVAAQSIDLTGAKDAILIGVPVVRIVPQWVRKRRG